MDNQTYCWICKKAADSAEHRIKKSDLVTLHGSGAYKGENTLLMFRGEQEIPIQGPNSKVVKYKKILCANCNNNFSQPFDKSYELFVDYILNNEDLVIKRRFVDFRDVYGDEFEVGQCNLYKYFVKSFGCRLANDDHPVPEDLPVLLSKRRFRTKLRITFSVDEEYLDFGFHILANGPLMTYLPLQETRPTWLEKWRYKQYGRGHTLQYVCSESFKWLSTWCWYNIQPDGKFGSSWVADSQYVYLGSNERLSHEKRKEIIEEMRSSEDL
jgi:hypothetical protein